MADFAEDPTVARIRDVLGALRCLYRAAPKGPAQNALAIAAREVKTALGAATSSRRDKELAGALRDSRRALQQAARAAPWASPVLMGALAHLPGDRRVAAPVDPPRTPLPPFHER